jgi:gliding motility-associated-like protein
MQMFIHSRAYHVIVIIAIWLGSVDMYSQAACNFSKGPVGELCSSAIYICGDKLDGFKGKLPDSLSAPQQWSGLCNGSGTADNIIWFSFTPCTKKVCLEIVPVNCTTVVNGSKSYSGVQAGLYSGCNRNSWVACSDHANDNGITTAFTLCYDDFVPGETAFLYLDGYANSVCEFTIKVLEGIDTTPVSAPDPSMLEDGAITGKNIVACSERGTPVRYNLTPPEDSVVFNTVCQQAPEVDPSDSICFVWQVSPQAGRFFNGKDSTGTFVDIVFTEPGTYTVSANGYFHPYYGGSCANGAMGDILSWTVIVKGPDTIVNPPVFLCPGASALFCQPELLITSDTLVYCKSDDCTIVAQSYVFGTTKVNDMGLQYICAGSAFSFQGQTYTSSGSFEVVDATDCSLKHTFDIKIIDVKAELTAPLLEINCRIPEITVSGNGLISGSPAGSSLLNTWFGPDGGKLLDGNVLKVNKAGTYRLQTTLKAGDAVCLDELSFQVTADFTKPLITAQIPTITCKDNKGNLIVQSSLPLVRSTWETPLGNLISNTLTIQVDSVNCTLQEPYAFTAEAANGCKTDTSFIIPINFRKPEFLLETDTITCYSPGVFIRVVNIDIPADLFRWEKTAPVQEYYAQTTAPIPNQPFTEGGTYRVSVRARDTGCWAVDSIDISENKTPPSLISQGPYFWYCNTQRINLTAITDAGLPLNYYWTTTDGALFGNISQQSIEATSPGNYELQVTNVENGCSKNQRIAIIEDTNKPTNIAVAATDISCFGKNDGTLKINGVTGGYEPYRYYLNGQPVNANAVSMLPEGTYTIEVSDKYDCKKSVDVSIQEPAPLQIFASEDSVNIYITEAVDLTFTSNYPLSELASIIWRDVDGNIVGNDEYLRFQPDESGNIELLVITDKGCEERTKIKIVVEKDLDITIPNIFSPNGDGINDRLIIFKNKIPAKISRMTVFDRYGNKVFDDAGMLFNDPAMGWDGTFNGKAIQPGVYILILEIIDFTGSKKRIVKDLTILK